MTKCPVPLSSGMDFCCILNTDSVKQIRYIDKESLWEKYYIHAPRPRSELEKKYKPQSR